MKEPIRISPEEVHDKIISGNALFVSAYEDEVTFRKTHLEGGLSLAELKSMLPTLSKEQEIIFYCG